MEIKRRWKFESLDPSDPLLLASAIDPRAKTLTFLAKDSQVHVQLSSEPINKMREYEQHNGDDEASAVDPPPKRKKTVVDILLGREVSVNSLSIEDELERFIANPVLSQNSCPLAW